MWCVYWPLESLADPLFTKGAARGVPTGWSKLSDTPVYVLLGMAVTDYG